MISMPLKVTKAIRCFEFNGALLPDPNSSLDLAKVKEILALAHPEIATAEITGPTSKNGTLVFHVERVIGSKG
jgi:PRTRC genetic system protein C